MPPRPSLPIPEPPPFPGVGGAIEPYSGSECHTVFIAGDSLFNTVAASLDDALAESGRVCNTVKNRSVDGSSTGDWLDPGHGLWTSLLAETVPGDILILQLAGNSGLWAGPAYGDPAWLAQNAANARRLTDDALAAGLHVYWVIPPKSGIFCNFASQSALHLLEWKGWLTSTLPGLYPGQIRFIDWRGPFGGETYSGSFTFDDGVHPVRHADCVHFVTRGNEVAADAATFAIQHEWAPPAIVSAGASTTSSSSTTTSSTTTSSTSPDSTSTTGATTTPTT